MHLNAHWMSNYHYNMMDRVLFNDLLIPMQKIQNLEIVTILKKIEIFRWIYFDPFKLKPYFVNQKILTKV